jgi:hydroxymethylglutaryl-CoA lyase
LLEERLPEAVTVYEVGPRDGLQNEPEPVGADVKVELIERLTDAGLPAVEATSFVRPEWVPQLADAEQVAAALDHGNGTRYPVLVPNEGGLRRAIDAGAREIAVFGSATETFARRNLNRSIDESLAMFAPVVRTARDEGLRVRGYVSMVWGDPWEGAVPVEQAADAARRLWELGLDELALGDTIGVATPVAVDRVIRAVQTHVPTEAIAVHFHDTYGQALANVLAALEAGITTVDASVAGLGGCPYAQSATGNLATEDLVYMLDGLGIRTGVDLEAVIETAHWIAAELGREPGAVARASTPSRRGRP